jgi:hypothetical protein
MLFIEKVCMLTEQGTLQEITLILDAPRGNNQRVKFCLLSYCLFHETPRSGKVICRYCIFKNFVVGYLKCAETGNIVLLWLINDNAQCLDYIEVSSIGGMILTVLGSTWIKTCPVSTSQQMPHGLVWC